MALGRGFGAIKKAKKEAEQRRERTANATRDFFLQGDGASAKVWFNGPSDEPIIALHHQFKIDGRFYSELCAYDHDGHPGCVYCHAEKNGDKRISKPKQVVIFNVFDTRWVHKRKNAEKTEKAGGKFDKFDWFDCKGDPDNDEPDKSDKAACKWCRKGVERVRSGQKKTKFSVTAAGVLDAQNDSAKKKCICGGKLSLEGYKNGKKHVPDLDDVDDPENWEPVYECRKCEDPAPRSIRCCPVEITRSGSGTNTSYNFIPVWDEMGDPPDYVQEAEIIELEEVLVPKSADEMAEQIGVKNPFDKSKKSKAKDYDDDDDEEDPHDEDDEDEDEDDDDDD